MHYILIHNYYGEGKFYNGTQLQIIHAHVDNGVPIHIIVHVKLYHTDNKLFPLPFAFEKANKYIIEINVVCCVGRVEIQTEI